MSPRTRCPFPVAKKLLTPRALNNKHVSLHLKSKHMQQKAFYDRGAKPLPPRNPQQVVRLQTSKGYEKAGVVKQPTADPRCYIVNVGEEITTEIADIFWACSFSSWSNQSECCHFSYSSQPECFSFLLCWVSTRDTCQVSSLSVFSREDLCPTRDAG